MLRFLVRLFNVSCDSDHLIVLSPLHTKREDMDNENRTPQPNNPLHGITLKTILEYLVEKYGWKELGEMIRINCFSENPSIKSSLNFLRKTPWAREKVEELYLCCIEED